MFHQLSSLEASLVRESVDTTQHERQNYRGWLGYVCLLERRYKRFLLVSDGRTE